jgi:hypothetical protein
MAKTLEDILRSGLGPERSRKSRAARWAGRKIRRGIWWTLKRFVVLNWRRWVILGPFQAAMVLWATSALVHLAHQGWVVLLAVLAAAAIAPYWFVGLPFPLANSTRPSWIAQLINSGSVLERAAGHTAEWCRETAQSMTRRVDITRAQRYWVLGGYAAATALATWGAAVGPGIRKGNPIPGLWLFWALGCGWAWWWAWHAHRNPAQEVREDTAEIDERLAVWAEFGPSKTTLMNLRNIEKVLPGVPATSTVDLVKRDKPTVIGWRADGIVERGKGTAKRIITLADDVAGIFDTTVENVALEEGRGNARRFAVSVFTHNPLRLTTRFPGPVETFDYPTGVARIGIYADCETALYRFYRRGSGPVHDLIAGTSDAGKSRLVEMLLAMERACPFITSVVIDPQRGQSLPAFKSQKGGTVHRTAGFATSVEEGLYVLRAVHKEMLDRNAYLANIGWTDVDADGVEHDEEGVDAFDPLSGPTAGMKLIVLTIEEAHAILANEEGLVLVEAIAKMARKCGIKLRLITQVPLLDQLGGSTTLRDMVAAGNVIVLRTANPLSGQVAFNGNLPVDPKSLPREWEIDRPDGTIERITTAGLGFVLGPGARSAPFRSFFLGEEVRAYARAGETAELVMTDPELMGITLNELLLIHRRKAAGQPYDDLIRSLQMRNWLGENGVEVEDAAAKKTNTAPAPAEKSGDWAKVQAYLAERGPFGATKNVIREATQLERQNVDTVIRRRRAKKPPEIVEVRAGLFVLAAHAAAASALYAAVQSEDGELEAVSA